MYGVVNPYKYMYEGNDSLVSPLGRLLILDESSNDKHIAAAEIDMYF